jgi:FkbM family methyltransferase
LEFFARISEKIGKPRGWERLVRWFTSPEKCAGTPDICLIRDDYIFVAQPAVQLGWHVCIFGTYEPQLRNIIRLVLRPGGVAMDVGANVGWHTLLMARSVGDQGRVMAVEPNPSVRERLNQHVNINKFDHVDILPFAASDTDGTAEFYGIAAEAVNSGSSHLLAKGDNRASDQINVETRKIDRMISEAGIQRLDFIKLDIEGHEWPALMGAQDSIARFRPHIVFEYGADYAIGTPDEMTKFFKKHRYRLFSLRRSGAPEMRPADWAGQAEIWAVPAD